MHLASKALFLGGLILGAASCGGGSSGTSTGGSTTHTGGSTSGTGGSTATTTSSGPSAAMACADLAHAQCTERETCSMDGFLNKRTYGDEATCEARVAPTCVANLGAKGTAQTPAKIEGCVAQFSSYTCTDFLDGNPPAGCVPPAGTLANGAACGASAQCSSSYCSIPQDQVCGTCAALPVAGAPCQIGADCGRNLACATPTGASSGTCAPFALSGAACLTGTSPCAAGLACVGDVEATKTMGSCKPQGTKVGDACDGSRKTLANCDGTLGLVCIPAAKGSPVGTCQNITLVDAGATCGDVGAMPITGFADCHSGAVCIKNAPADPTGKCVAPAADGAACDSDPAKGPPCLAPARCVPTSSTGTAGTCKVPDATKCM